jgi:hypothetical protein
LPHVGFLGLKLVGVLLKSDKLLSLIDDKVGDTCDVQVGSWETAQMRADVILVDGVGSLSVMEVARQSGAQLVLAQFTSGPQRESRTRDGPKSGANKSLTSL